MALDLSRNVYYQLLRFIWNGKSNLLFDNDDDDDDDDEIRFVSDQHALFCIFIVLTHWHDR